MFPLNSNLPYIKDDGTRDKLGNVIGSGGGGGSELPPHTIEDAGKVLGIDDTGALAWVTVKGGGNFAKVSTEPDALNPIINAKGVEQ